MHVAITTSAILASASLISAQCGQQKSGSDPTPGYQAISSPAADSQVTAGESTQITWTTGSSPAGNVALQLCTGPSTNCVPGACIAESTSNSGSYTWNVPSSLDTTGSNGGYGILIINIPSGAFQYSPHFGAKAGASLPSSSAPAAISSAPAAGVINQIADGQIQAAGATLSVSAFMPDYTPSTPAGYSSPVYSTGFSSSVSYGTGYKPSYAPNTAPYVQINTTYVPIPTAGPQGTAPAGAVSGTNALFPVVTSVPGSTGGVGGSGAGSGSGSDSGAGAGAGVPNGPIVPSASTTPFLTSPANAGGKVVAGGSLAVLGAMAALLLL